MDKFEEYEGKIKNCRKIEHEREELSEDKLIELYDSWNYP